MASGEPGPSNVSPARPEQKTLIGDFPLVPSIDIDTESDDYFVDAREHSFSAATHRNDFYNAQRIERRRGSSGSRPSSAGRRPASSESRSRSTDKRPVSSEYRPVSADKYPADSEYHLDSAEARPASSEKWPASAERYPAIAEGRHFSADQSPAVVAEPPASAEKPSTILEEHPTDVVEASAISSEPPTDTEKLLINPEQRAVDSERYPWSAEDPFESDANTRPTSITSQSTARPKGKRPNVDFRDLPESTSRGDAATTEGASQPEHSRGNSYTNFSRPDTIRRNSSKSGVHTSALQPKSSMTALPPHAATVTKSANKQNRTSGTSTVGSRRLRPPVHQSDIEHGIRNNSEESAPIPPFAQTLRTDFLGGKKATPEPPVGWLSELYIISYLIFFAFWGTLARLGLEWLTFYPGAITTTPVIWANFAGSLLMGFLVEDSRLFRDEWPDHVSTTSRAEKRISKQSNKSRRSVFSGDFDRMQKREREKAKAGIPLYIGLTTGFCGCTTSFSIIARDMFLALSNDLPAPPYHTELTGVNVARHGGYSFMAVIAVIITELAVSIGGFVAGRHLALLFEDYTPRISLRFTRRILNPLVVLLGWGCWLGAVILMIWPPDRPEGPQTAGTWDNETWRGLILFSMVFCPLGCLLRYFLGRRLNRLEPSFPLGTFAANMLGVAVLAACYNIQHIAIGDGGIIGSGLLNCQAMEGVIDGFTGCLTTVSTFVAELDALKRRYSWIYGLSTIVAGLGLAIAILGPVRWTVGWSSPACATGYIDKYS